MWRDLNFTRAVATAFGAVLLAPCLALVLAGFAPNAPVIGRLGALIHANLPMIAIGAATAAVLGIVALRAGGSAVQAVLAGAALATLAGAALILGQVLVVAGDQGVAIDLVRAAGLGMGNQAGSAVPDKTVTLGDVMGTTLSAEVWLPDPAASTSGLGRAGIVYVHGGGFTGGGLRSRPRLFRAWADLGIPVIDVSYRLSPPPSWDEATPDVLCALAWLRDHGQALGIDPGKIVVVGDSAGGNLALMAAYGAGLTGPISSCGGSPLTPAGVVAIAPAADLASIWGDRSISAGSRPFPEAYLGGTPEELPDRYRAASPATLIRPGLPATLIIQGSIDRLVKPDHARALAASLRAADVDCGLLMIPYAYHGFDGAPDAYGSQIEEAVVPAFIAAHTGGPAWSGPDCPVAP